MLQGSQWHCKQIFFPFSFFFTYTHHKYNTSWDIAVFFGHLLAAPFCGTVCAAFALGFLIWFCAAQKPPQYLMKCPKKHFCGVWKWEKASNHPKSVFSAFRWFGYLNGFGLQMLKKSVICTILGTQDGYCKGWSVFESQYNANFQRTKIATGSVLYPSRKFPISGIIWLIHWSVQLPLLSQPSGWLFWVPKTEPKMK